MVSLLVEPTENPQVARVTFETDPAGVGAVEFGPAGRPATHRVDDLGGTVHELLVVGMTAGEWDLVALAEGPSGATRAPAEVFEVPALEGAPDVALAVPADDRSAGGWFLLDVNINGTGTPRAMVVDDQGGIVWTYDPGRGEDVGAVDVTLTPGGDVLMGGSMPEGLNPVELGLDGEVRWTGPLQPGFAQDGFVHHHTDALPDGSHVALEKDVRDGHRGDRVVLRDRDGAVSWTWSTWDHWEPDLTVEEWTHCNWLELHADHFFLSDQHSSTIWKIDRATGEPTWVMGAGGDFTLTSGGTWFSGQHAPQWGADGRLWVYDNGRGRGRSRVVAYVVDEAGRTVTEDEVWDGGAEWGWYAGFWGSVDSTSPGRVLVGAGHPEFRRALEVDLASGDVVGGFVLPPPFAFYRVRHLDPGAAFRVQRLP